MSVAKQTAPNSGSAADGAHPGYARAARRRDCQRFCRLALVAAQNIIRPVIAVPRIDAIDRIAIRQRCFGDDDPEHLTFFGPLELEDVAIAFRKRVFPEWKIGVERTVREPDG